MAEISAGRFNRWIQKLFYLQTGGPASVYSVDTAIQPGIQVFSGVEERYLQGWNRFAITAFVTGAAAASSAIQIRNPANSAVVCVLERIGFDSATASAKALISYSAIGVSTDLTTQVFAVRLDGRIQPGSSMIISTSTNAIGLSSIINAGAGAGSAEYQPIVTQNQEIPILPGGALNVLDQALADGAAFNLMWRERVMEQSELT